MAEVMLPSSWVLDLGNQLIRVRSIQRIAFEENEKTGRAHLVVHAMKNMYRVDFQQKFLPNVRLYCRQVLNGEYPLTCWKDEWNIPTVVVAAPVVVVPQPLSPPEHIVVHNLVCIRNADPANSKDFPYLLCTIHAVNEEKKNATVFLDLTGNAGTQIVAWNDIMPVRPNRNNLDVQSLKPKVTKMYYSLGQKALLQVGYYISIIQNYPKFVLVQSLSNDNTIVVPWDEIYLIE